MLEEKDFFPVPWWNSRSSDSGKKPAGASEFGSGRYRPLDGVREGAAEYIYTHVLEERQFDERHGPQYDTTSGHPFTPNRGYPHPFSLIWLEFAQDLVASSLKPPEKRLLGRA
jgi:hypothetical protein